MAKARTINDLFHDTLKDIYFAEKRILKALPKMHRAAQDEKLKSAFDTHRDQTETQIERLGQIFDALGKSPRGKTCDAIEGIVAEADEIMADYKGSPALDAGLVAAAQAVEHYEIARYGALHAWANALGMTDVAALLAETLDEEKKTDALLSKLASTLNLSEPSREDEAA
jgi:ferritin-like metal-binding protein YciE